MCVQPVPWPEPDPRIAAAVEAKYPGQRARPLAVVIRDRLGEWLGDVQFAAAVAYYYRFEAPGSHRKSEIGADDLREACRLVNRERFSNPLQTLQNARNLGLLDRPTRGMFSINSVGENLVAMTLPSDERPTTAKGKRPERKIIAKKKKAARK